MKIYRSLIEAAKDLAPVMQGPVSVRIDNAPERSIRFTWLPPIPLSGEPGRWVMPKSPVVRRALYA